MDATAAAPQDDAGFTLLEVLIAVAILGVAFASILGGLGVSVLTSDIHRKQADAHALLVSSAEAVKDNQLNPYVQCATAGSYNPLNGIGPSLPSGWSSSVLTVTSVTHWNGTAWVGSGSCTSDFTLQRVSLRIVSPDARADESLSLVKRKP